MSFSRLFAAAFVFVVAPICFGAEPVILDETWRPLPPVESGGFMREDIANVAAAVSGQPIADGTPIKEISTPRITVSESSPVVALQYQIESVEATGETHDIPAPPLGHVTDAQLIDMSLSVRGGAVLSMDVGTVLGEAHGVIIDMEAGHELRSAPVNAFSDAPGSLVADEQPVQKFSGK